MATLGLARAGDASAQTPSPLSATPVTAHLQSAVGVPDHGHPPKPFLHPRGKDELDRGKQAAQNLAKGRHIQQPGSGVTTNAPQTAGIGFRGISQSESSCGCEPPDG